MTFIAMFATNVRSLPVSKLALCPEGFDPELLLVGDEDCVPVPVAGFDDEGCPGVARDEWLNPGVVTLDVGGGGGGGADDDIRVTLCVID